MPFVADLIFLLSMFASRPLAAISIQVYRNYDKTAKEDRRVELKMVFEAWGLGIFLLVTSLFLIHSTHSSVAADMSAVAGKPHLPRSVWS